MSFVKQLAGETAIYGVGNILSRILNFVFLTGYLTRVFTDRALFGIHQDLYAYMAVLLILFTYRMETAYFRMGTEADSENKTFFTAFFSILASTAFFCSIIWIFRSEIAEILKYPGREIYILYMILIISFDALAAIPFARLRLKNQAWKFAGIRLANVVLTIFLVVFFLEICPYLIDKEYLFFEKIYNPSRELDLVIIANIISSIAVFLLLLPQITAYKPNFDFTQLKKMLWYIAPLVIVALAGVFNQYFAVPLIKFLLPGADNMDTAGLYAAAAKLAVLMYLFTQAFVYAAEPFFFKRAKKKDAKSTYADVAQAFALAASVLLLLIALYIDVFKYILGPTYREGVFVVPILLVAFWMLGLYYNFSIWYKIEDKTYIGALISVGGAIVTLIIAASLLPRLGMIGMAWAALACYTFMAGASYLTGLYYYPVRYPIWRMLGYLLFALIVYLISRALQNYFGTNNISQFFISSGLFLFYLFTLHSVERERVRSWIGIKE